MSFTLVLNSSNVSSTSTNSSFKYNFIQGGFKAKDCEMCISSVSIPYSWYNVSSYYNNKLFSLEFPSASGFLSTPCILPDGYYTVTDINAWIEQKCLENGLYLIDSTGKNIFFMHMAYNATYYSVQLLCYVVPTALGTYTRPATGLYSTTGTGLPLFSGCPRLNIPSTGSIGTIIGFTAASYPAGIQSANQSFLSNKTPIGTTVNSLILQCSLVSNRVTIPSDILDSMPITNAAFGANIVYDPSFEKFVSIADGTYNNFTIAFKDQNFNDVYARDPNSTITLIIRQKNNI
jgi:hypothetical protein